MVKIQEEEEAHKRSALAFAYNISLYNKAATVVELHWDNSTTLHSKEKLKLQDY